MRKKYLIGIISILLSLGFTGCSKSDPEKNYKEVKSAYDNTIKFNKKYERLSINQPDGENHITYRDVDQSIDRTDIYDPYGNISSRSILDIKNGDIIGFMRNANNEMVGFREEFSDIINKENEKDLGKSLINSTLENTVHFNDKLIFNEKSNKGKEIIYTSKNLTVTINKSKNIISNIIVKNDDGSIYECKLEILDKLEKNDLDISASNKSKFDFTKVKINDFK